MDPKIAAGLIFGILVTHFYLIHYISFSLRSTATFLNFQIFDSSLIYVTSYCYAESNVIKTVLDCFLNRHF